jgi:hypothetical protein
VGGAPGEDRENRYNRAWDQDHDCSDFVRTIPVGRVLRSGILGAVFPGERECHRNNRKDDNKHEPGR